MPFSWSGCVLGYILASYVRYGPSRMATESAAKILDLSHLCGPNSVGTVSVPNAKTEMGPLLRSRWCGHDSPCLRLKAAKLLQDWVSDHQLGAGCNSREGRLYRETTGNVHVPRGNDLSKDDRKEVRLGETLCLRNGHHVPT